MDAGTEDIARALPRQGRAFRRSSRQGDGKAPENAAEAWRGDQVTSVDKTGIGHVMRMMYISLRKALIVGASTTAVLRPPLRHGRMFSWWTSRGPAASSAPRFLQEQPHHLLASRRHRDFRC